VIEANTWVDEPYQVLLINGLSTKLLLSNGSSQTVAGRKTVL